MIQYYPLGNKHGKGKIRHLVQWSSHLNVHVVQEYPSNVWRRRGVNSQYSQDTLLRFISPAVSPLYLHPHISYSIRLYQKSLCVEGCSPTKALESHQITVNFLFKSHPIKRNLMKNPTRSSMKSLNCPTKSWTFNLSKSHHLQVAAAGPVAPLRDPITREPGRRPSGLGGKTLGKVWENQGEYDKMMGKSVPMLDLRWWKNKFLFWSKMWGVFGSNCGSVDGKTWEITQPNMRS